MLLEAQHCFRNEHSTITNLIELLTIKLLDSRNNVDLIITDFSNNIGLDAIVNTPADKIAV